MLDKCRNENVNDFPDEQTDEEVNKNLSTQPNKLKELLALYT